MCGVVGVFGKENATELTLDMMEALQHRGHQSSGCVLIGNDGEVIFERELGIILNLLKQLKEIDVPLDTFSGIGQLRYGTAGSRDKMENAQPLYVGRRNAEIYLAHNGDTPYDKEMREELLAMGAKFSITSDTELICQYIAKSREEDSIDAILDGLSSYRGTYAITMLLKDDDGSKLIVARDHSGNRPLWLGKKDDSWLVASEDIAFEAIEGKSIREILPGEMLVISNDGLSTRIIPNKNELKSGSQHCVFENIYFSFPNSLSFGVPVGKFQEELGKIVARKLRNLVLDSDVITNIPDSSNLFMDGFSSELNKFPTRAIIRKHNYRSFTESSKLRRESVVRKKHSFNGEKVSGKRVWVLDDSIVRGSTSRKIIRALRKHGATWVGMISSAPPVIGQCRKGIDFEEDLVAGKYLDSGTQNYFLDEIRKEIEADFLFYTSIEDLRESLRVCNANPSSFCFGCFTGKEPVFGAW